MQALAQQEPMSMSREDRDFWWRNRLEPLVLIKPNSCQTYLQIISLDPLDDKMHWVEIWNEVQTVTLSFVGLPDRTDAIAVLDRVAALIQAGSVIMSCDELIQNVMRQAVCCNHASFIDPEDGTIRLRDNPHYRRYKLQDSLAS